MNGLAAAGGEVAVLSRQSFIELSARERALSLLDSGTARELLGPFDRLESPWLEAQGLVPQSDDGVVVLRGRLDGQPAVLLAIEGAFLGGAVGEVSGAKIAGALELALRDWTRGVPTRPVLLLETGGVRLQEANLGLAAIAEVHAAIVALRAHVPVVGVVAGMVGCFGGMAIAAGLCSSLIVTRQARLGLNGPEVIEQEAGAEELDASDRPSIWRVTGGEQRAASHLADTLVGDDAAAIRAAVHQAFRAGLPSEHRSAAVERYRALLAASDPGSPASDAAPVSSRGRRWFEALAGAGTALPGYPASVLIADGLLGERRVRYLAVAPDPRGRFPRAHRGEVGLEEGWSLAAAVRDALLTDAACEDADRRALVAIVDVPSQAYGRLEEVLGLHLACAAASDAYATARLAGHPVVSLIVGHAFSGGFLAHGAQANRLLALDDPGVSVHAMGRNAAARVTRRSVADLDALGERVLPMAYDIRSYALLGLLHALVEGVNAEDPGPADVALVRTVLAAVIGDAQSGPRDLSVRLTSAGAREGRTASIAVRERLTAAWDR
jgi:malonate decarboxylase beta subunit